MIITSTEEYLDNASAGAQEKHRYSTQDQRPTALADIYEPEVNLTIWQRTLPTTLIESAKHLLQAKPELRIVTTVTPAEAFPYLTNAVGTEHSELVENIAQLVDMFCCLFDLRHAGLRLTGLNTAMCPKFHVDRVPCRLVTTYHGSATEWLPHHRVNREKLGARSNGLPDSESGVFANQSHIQQMNCGDVALLKGELWQDNDGAGLVHRSPALAHNENRLLLTLDLVD